MQRMGKLLEICASNINDKNIYFNGSIPPKKLNNAIKKYILNADPDSVVMLVDNTRFGSADEGMAMTTDALYMRNGKNVNHIALDEINSIKALDDTIYINKIAFCKLSTSSKESLEKLSLVMNGYVNGSLDEIALLIESSKEFESVEGKASVPLPNALKNKGQAILAQHGELLIMAVILSRHGAISGLLKYLNGIPGIGIFSLLGQVVFNKIIKFLDDTILEKGEGYVMDWIIPLWRKNQIRPQDIVASIERIPDLIMDENMKSEGITLLNKYYCDEEPVAQ